MGSYWAGYSGQGLCLSGKEFEKFLEKYKTKCPDKAALAQIEEFEEGSITLSEVDFIAPNGEKFNMFCADADSTEGFRLIPYHMDGKTNTDEKINSAIPFNDVYVLPADKAIDSTGCFAKRAYESYMAFRSEFKRKMQKYLPYDFDWDPHIGRFTYACYA